MPVKDNFTAKEMHFVAAYAKTGDKTHAAKIAGYAQNKVQRVLDRPAVLAALAAEQEKRVYEKLLPAALTCLEDLITNKATPAGARVSACKIVIDTTINKDNQDKREKAPHELSADELHETLERLRQEAAARAHEIIEAVALPAPDGEPEEDLFT